MPDSDKDYVAMFQMLVGDYHVDPTAAFECLQYAKAEGENVERHVREIWEDVGIKDTEELIQAVTRHYSQGPGAAPKSRDDTFGVSDAARAFDARLA